MANHCIYEDTDWGPVMFLLPAVLRCLKFRGKRGAAVAQWVELVIGRSLVRIPAPLGWNWATCRSILEQDIEPQNCSWCAVGTCVVASAISKGPEMSWRLIQGVPSPTLTGFCPVSLPEKGEIKHIRNPLEENVTEEEKDTLKHPDIKRSNRNSNLDRHSYCKLSRKSLLLSFLNIISYLSCYNIKQSMLWYDILLHYCILL